MNKIVFNYENDYLISIGIYNKKPKNTTDLFTIIKEILECQK